MRTTPCCCFRQFSGVPGTPTAPPAARSCGSRSRLSGWRGLGNITCDQQGPAACTHNREPRAWGEAARATAGGLPVLRRSTSCSCRLPICSFTLAISLVSDCIRVVRPLKAETGQLLELWKPGIVFIGCRRCISGVGTPREKT